MKKIYKLLIMYDTEDEECEALSETVDIIDNNDELLSKEDFNNKDVRKILIESQIMGDA